MDCNGWKNIESLKAVWPKKFASEEEIFRHIHAGDRIFIGTGCGEPKYLVQALVNYYQRLTKEFGINLIYPPSYSPRSKSN